MKWRVRPWLAGLLMCGAKLDLHGQLSRAPADSPGHRPHGWIAASPAARAELLRRVQALLPAHLMLPDARLDVLVEQALRAQVHQCLFHNSRARPMTLLTDYRCGPEQLPTRTVQILEEHPDEVWHLAWSHSGRYLASGSKDGTAIIWEVASLTGVSLRARWGGAG